MKKPANDFNNRNYLGLNMSDKRVMRKLKKLASRIHSKIETVRDEMDDLEIEFELLQQHIQKLENSPSRNVPSDEVEVTLEEDNEEIDLENSSAVQITKKF